MLAELRAGAKQAFPALMDAVNDPSFAVRNTAVYALGRIGPDAAEAWPLLVQALRDWQSGGSSEGLAESAAFLGATQKRKPRLGIHWGSRTSQSKEQMAFLHPV